MLKQGNNESFLESVFKGIRFATRVSAPITLFKRIRQANFAKIGKAKKED
jgi:hypothetical protein